MKPSWPSGAEVIFVCLFVFGAVFRIVGLLEPLQYPSWREFDIAAIARNFYREDMNLFYPQIDWRGAGPGYGEMEFPAFPWFMALLYHLFGPHELLGRLISFVLSLGGLIVFFKLARYLLPTTAAIAASVFITVNPLLKSVSLSIQSEGLMFLCYILAAFAFIRWVESDSWKDYTIAMVATAMAILAKASAAHIGIFFACLLLSQRGVSALSLIRTWLFGLGALLPPILWYAHARGFWTTYGLSLGVSNEYHWAGLDLFTNPVFVRGIVTTEFFFVWMPTGVLVAVFALLFKLEDRVVKYSVYWLLAAAAFYLVTARTSGDSWALYYHVFSVPPAALLVGSGVEAILSFSSISGSTFYGRSAVALLLAWITLLFLFVSPDLLPQYGSPRWLQLSMALWFGGCTSVLLFFGGKGGSLITWLERRGLGLPSLVSGGVFAVCAVVAAPFAGEAIIPKCQPGLHTCASTFAPMIPQSALIVASGGRCKDPDGYPLAYNLPYMFYWMDRKGWNICVEEQAIERIRSLADRGAQWFVAEKAAVQAVPGFEAMLRSEFPLVSECDEAWLFRVTPEKAPSKL